MTVQVLSRNEDTGKVKLRLNPLNADTVYAEKGGAATVASHKVTDMVYETDALELSFLAVDSRGDHVSSEPIPWRNTISLKWGQRWIADALQVELHAAPKSPIRYTTDGSNPKTHGGTYDGLFIVPKIARVIQAVAESDGIVSDILQIPVNWDDRREFKIDPSRSATWTREHRIGDTQAAYTFLKRVQKHGASITGGEVTLAIEQSSERWVQFVFGQNVTLLDFNSSSHA